MCPYQRIHKTTIAVHLLTFLPSYAYYFSFCMFILQYFNKTRLSISPCSLYLLGGIEGGIGKNRVTLKFS